MTITNEQRSAALDRIGLALDNRVFSDLLEHEITKCRGEDRNRANLFILGGADRAEALFFLMAYHAIAVANILEMTNKHVDPAFAATMAEHAVDGIQRSTPDGLAHLKIWVDNWAKR